MVGHGSASLRSEGSQAYSPSPGGVAPAAGRATHWRPMPRSTGCGRFDVGVHALRLEHLHAHREANRVADVADPVLGPGDGSSAEHAVDAAHERYPRRAEPTSRTTAADAATIGRINGEWNACDTVNPLTLMPSASRTPRDCRGLDVGTRDDVCPGPLIAATATRSSRPEIA